MVYKYIYKNKCSEAWTSKNGANATRNQKRGIISKAGEEELCIRGNSLKDTSSEVSPKVNGNSTLVAER